MRARGAAALEFVFLFPLIVALFWIAMVYGVTFLVANALEHAAAEGARASLAAADESEVDGVVRARVTEALAWMPEDWREHIAVTTAMVDRRVTVRVDYAGYAAAAPLPSLQVPGLGPVPSLPAQLGGRASVLYNQPDDVPGAGEEAG